MPVLALLAAATLAVPAPVNLPSAPATLVYQTDAALREGRSEVLVLGTAHLSALPDTFDRTHFAPLLDRLAAWKPAVIAIEALGGAQCAYLRSHVFAYPDTAETYCPDPQPAQQALGLSQPQAEAQIEALLAKPVADRPAAERRRLIMLFLASGDPASAWVQWLRLPEAERHAGDALPAALAERFTKKRGCNENVDIAAALAARLGLERVYPVDDHTGDRATGPTDAEFDKALGAIWQGKPGAAAAHDAYEASVKRFEKGGDVLAFYRHANSQPALRDAVRYDFAAAAGDRSPGKVGRRYLAYWETRNLRMVANIREAIGPNPGTRALVIVGSSHKPYYERYLGVLSEVKLAEVGKVLR